MFTLHHIVLAQLIVQTVFALPLAVQAHAVVRRMIATR
jgi:hypothetical protein